MGFPPPRLRDMPDVFPVFPLTGALLLPRGRLPLNIFEPRYLAMTEDALAAGRVFGMIQPDWSRPGGDAGPGLFRVGCLGRLSSFSETDDGRYLITLTGLIRFTVLAELDSQRGYRRVRADVGSFAADLLPPPETDPYERETLLRGLRGYFQRHGFEANWEAITQLDDEMLVTTLSMVCPFDAAEKQALLEAPTLTERAATLIALLEMDSHDPAAERRKPS